MGRVFTGKNIRVSIVQDKDVIARLNEHAGINSKVWGKHQNIKTNKTCYVPLGPIETCEYDA